MNGESRDGNVMADGGAGAGQEIKVEYRIWCGKHAHDYALYLGKQAGC